MSRFPAIKAIIFESIRALALPFGVPFFTAIQAEAYLVVVERAAFVSIHVTGTTAFATEMRDVPPVNGSDTLVRSVRAEDCK
jgi:hypothetical protein